MHQRSRRRSRPTGSAAVAVEALALARCRDALQHAATPAVHVVLVHKGMMPGGAVPGGPKESTIRSAGEADRVSIAAKKGPLAGGRPRRPVKPTFRS